MLELLASVGGKSDVWIRGGEGGDSGWWEGGRGGDAAGGGFYYYSEEYVHTGCYETYTSWSTSTA